MRFYWFSFNDTADMERAFALREAVFTVEQGFAQEADRDAQDKTALHVVGLDDAEQVCCTARLFSTQPGVWHAGRIAVRSDARGRGLGRQLMGEIIRKARALGGRTLELGAQADKQGFYEAVGFSPYGELFLDAGYPHRMMRITL